jgi:hypothetical protein
MVVGRVVQLAAQEIKDKLLAFAGERFGLGEVELSEGVFVAGGKQLGTLSEIASAYTAEKGALRAYAFDHAHISPER